MLLFIISARRPIVNGLCAFIAPQPPPTLFAADIPAPSDESAGRKSPDGAFRMQIRCFSHGYSEIPAGNTVFVVFYFLRRSACHNPPARISAAGAHIYDIIRIAYHIKIMLNDNHGGAAFKKRLKYAQQHLHIQRMQTDGRLVKDKNGSLASFSRCASPPESPGVSSPSVR